MMLCKDILYLLLGDLHFSFLSLQLLYFVVVPVATDNPFGSHFQGFVFPSVTELFAYYCSWGLFTQSNHHLKKL